MTQSAPLPPIQKVLCAIDLSDISSHVLACAAEVAEAYDARLQVLHVVEVWDSRYDFIVPEMRKRIEVEANAKVQAELAHLGKTNQIPVDVAVTKGGAITKIMEFIRTERPDVIVVGSHGKRGLDHLLLGSVAEKVLRVAPCSVLVVRPPKNPNVKSIVCAVDFSDCSRTALERALEIAKLEKLGSIKVLNVFEVPIGYMEAGMTYETALAKTQDVHQQELDEFLKPYASVGIKIEPHLQEGAPAATIVKFAEQAGADLLVIGSHGRSRFTAMLIGGSSAKIAHRATVPVLAVKAPQHYESLWQALDKL
jgi:nucleotide-binding universal stress UspA family protein